MIHVDTHVAIWTHAGRSRLSATARRLLLREPCKVSPAALLEIEILFELRRLASNAADILAALTREIDLSVATTPFIDIVETARTFAWARDPFDRLIVANAIADGAQLITADETILANFKDAVW